MARDNIDTLFDLRAVARERSFTRAAGKLGVSQSALSHAIGALEADIGVRLLTRTTRSVSLTDAGERLLRSVGPRLDAIEAALAAVNELGAKPSGTVRITTTDYAADTVLRPRLQPLLRRHPGLKIEMSIDYALADIEADGHDIGVRWGDQVARDMSAVRIAPDCRMAIVGAPSYLASRPAPRVPQDLLAHNCVNLRLAGSGAIYAWELKKGRRAVQVQVTGQATFNGVYQLLNAALSGNGLAFVPEDLAQPHVAAGRLGYVLESWFPTFPGLHLYHAGRQPSSRAVVLVVDALRLKD